jgi:hypothetical protein
VAFYDSFWAHVLSLYWLTDDYMRDCGERTLRDQARKADTRSDPSFLAVESLYALAAQSLWEADEAADSVRNLNMEWMNENYLQETRLFLTLSIEHLFIRDPHVPAWEEVASKWMANLRQPFQDDLRGLHQRLSLQRSIFYSDDSKSLDCLSPHCLHDIVLAIRATLDCDRATFSEAIDRAVLSTGFASPMAGIVTDLVQWGLWHRKSDAQEVRLTRQRLFEYKNSSRSPAWTNDLRMLSFWRTMFRLVQKNSTSGASDRFSCFRYALLNEIAALRAWDFGTWFESLRMKAIACEELSRWEDYRTEFAMRAIELSVAANAFSEKEINRKRLVRLFEKATPERRLECINKFLRLRHHAWSTVAEALALISDSIPLEAWPLIAQWSITYDNTPLDSLNGHSLSWFSFWGDMLGHEVDKLDLYKILHPLFLKLSQNPHMWGVDSNEALAAYVIEAPLDRALEVLGNMLKIRMDENQYEHRLRWAVIFDCSQKRIELLEHVKEWLTQHAQTPELRAWLGTLDPTSSSENDSELRTWISEKISGWLNLVSDRNRNSYGGDSGVSPNLLCNLKSDEPEEELVGELLASLDAPRITTGEVAHALQLLDGFVRAAAIPYANVRPHLKQLLEDPPIGVAVFAGGNDPLGSITFDGAGNESVWYQAFSLGVSCGVADFSGTADIIKEVLENSFFKLNDYALAPAFSMCVLMASRGCLDVSNGLNMVRLLWDHAFRNACRDEENYVPCLLMLRHARELLEENTRLALKQCSDDFVRTLLSGLDVWVQNLVLSPEVRVRFATAYLLKSWNCQFPDRFSENMRSCVEYLRSDPRARIRSVSRGISLSC